MLSSVIDPKIGYRLLIGREGLERLKSIRGSIYAQVHDT